MSTSGGNTKFGWVDSGSVGKTGARGPQGIQGNAGPPNTLAIGTVTSGATASATITGTSPNQTLNLVIPTSAGSDSFAKSSALVPNLTYFDTNGNQTTSASGQWYSFNNVGIGSAGSPFTVTAIADTSGTLNTLQIGSVVKNTTYGYVYPTITNQSGSTLTQIALNLNQYGLNTSLLPSQPTFTAMMMASGTFGNGPITGPVYRPVAYYLPATTTLVIDFTNSGLTFTNGTVVTLIPFAMTFPMSA